MKNIILLTHGDFSRGIAESTRYILGEIENVVPISITLNETIDTIKGMIDTARHGLLNDYPTVIITDLPGGSTTQAALSYIAGRKDFFLISGLNLGLLLDVAMLDLTDNYEANLKLLRESAEESKENIKLINDFDAEDVEDIEGEL